MSTTEKDILNAAITIIENRLISDGEMRITGFGRFYVSELSTPKRFGSDDSVPRNVVRFKPFSKLKKSVNANVIKLPKKLSEPPSRVTPRLQTDQDDLFGFDDDDSFFGV